MEVLSRIDELNKLTETRLIKTEQPLPKSYQKIFGDIKNVVMDMAKIVDVEHIKVLSEEQKNLEGQEIKTLEEHYSNNIYMAGGGLSELFIEGYNDSPKDLDIFITTNTLNQVGWGIDIKKVEYCLNEHVGSFSLEEEKEIVSSSYSTFIKVLNIIKGTHKEYPELKVEIIFSSESRLDFDLSFREFYSDGVHIYATNKALEGIKNKQIVYNTSLSSLQTIFRGKEFSERYGYTIKEENEKALYDLLSIYEKESPGLIVDTYALTKKYKTEEKLKELMQKVESNHLTSKQKKHYEKTLFVEQGKEEMAMAKQIERLGKAKEKGWDLEQVWEYHIPSSQNGHSSYRHKKTGASISLEDHLKVHEIELSERKQIDLKSIFKTLERQEASNIFEKLIDKTEEKLEELGYERKDKNRSRQKEYEMLKLDQYSVGIDDLNFGIANELYAYYFTENKKQMKKSLLSEKLYVKMGEENKVWDMKGRWMDKGEQEFQIQISYDSDEDAMWHDVTISHSEKAIKVNYIGNYLFMTGERKIAFEKLIKDTLKNMKVREVFTYRAHQIAEQYGNNTIREQKISDETLLKLKEIAEKEVKRPVADDDLPF